MTLIADFDVTAPLFEPGRTFAVQQRSIRREC
jgi:hypothetical protein